MILSRWRAIALVTLAVVAGAAALSWSRTPVYISSADVLVPPRSLVTGTAPLLPDMGSELAVASSARVRQLAATTMHTQPARLSGLSVSVPLNTHVLHISYAAPSPLQAQRNAQAFALAYVTFWKEQQGPLTPAAAPAGRPANATGMVAQVITPANLPSVPASPDHVTDVGIAVVIGLIAGFGTAWLRDRFDDRLRGVDDLELQAKNAVLTTIPGSPHGRRQKAAARKLRQPHFTAAAAYQDLRRSIERIAKQQGAKSVLVTSPLGDAHSPTATHLAVALARTHQRVVLVCAGPHPTHQRRGSVARFAGVGLADVIMGRATLASGLHQTDVPGLQVMPIGELDPHSPIAYDGPEARRTLGHLRATAAFVIIDGPAALGGHVGGIAEVSDMIVLVADGHTSRGQVRDATAQIEQYNERIVGWVLDSSTHRKDPIEPAPTEDPDPRNPLPRLNGASPDVGAVPHAGANGKPART